MQRDHRSAPAHSRSRHAAGIAPLGMALVLGAIAPSASAASPGAGTADDRRADFAQLWQEVTENYVYLGEHAAPWSQVPQRYAARVRSARTAEAWREVVASALAELEDFHIEVRPRPEHDWRAVPTCAALWAEWRATAAVVSAVQPGGPAARAGVLPGDEILAIDGLAPAQSIPAGDGQASRTHRLLQRLAGRADVPVLMSLRTPEGRVYEATVADCRVERPQEPVTTRRTAAGFGWIRFNNSLGDVATVAAFDAALASLADSPGLIVDLRDTPSGGNSTVALGVLGRFVTERGPYQRHRIPAYGLPDVEREWLEEVTPRGRPYLGPVVVLADHWTGSMGEGIASGFDGLRRALVLGTPMGRLNGSVESVRLRRTGLVVQFPQEQIFHVDGTPRHQWDPPRLVDLIATRGEADPELAAGERALEAAVAGAQR